MIKKTLFIVLVSGFTILACTNKETKTSQTSEPENTMEVNDGHNAQNSLDWAGTYEGTLPCADCPGIKTTITLKEDGTYQYVAEYLERNTRINANGNIMWHDNGSLIHLKSDDIDVKLKVIENGLAGLDTEGKEMEGASKDLYNYKKIK